MTSNLNTEEKEILGGRELQSLAKMNFPGGLQLSKFILYLLRINKINHIYKSYPGDSAHGFVNHVFQSLDIECMVNPAETKHIPASGPYITVSNHPFGGLDGLALFQLMLKINPNFKVIGNYMLAKISHLEKHIICVDPFNENAGRRNVSGIRLAMQHLKDGHPLGIFPAGEVSSYNPDYPGITDKKWSSTILRMIQKAGVPVVPVYFHGGNSRLFHLMGKVHPILRTLKLPSEMINSKNNIIHMSIRPAILPQEQQAFSDRKAFENFLRQRTYTDNRPALSIPISKSKEQQIARAENPDYHKAEIKGLRLSSRLFCNGHYEVFCTRKQRIPHLMFEIARQRERSFRQVGEGSGKAFDLDAFDEYYDQLIIWDREAEKLVGAYRIGKGDEILKHSGTKGLYTSSLFGYAPEFSPTLQQSIELGRSFIVEAYQRKALPLYLLWAGIFAFLQKHPQYKYLMGPVSISNTYTEQEKATMVNKLKENHLHPEWSGYVKAIHPYADPVITPYAQSKVKFPILLRKYLDLNGKILGFNIDPLFSYSLDALLILNLLEVPQQILDRFAKLTQESSN